MLVPQRLELLLWIGCPGVVLAVEGRAEGGGADAREGEHRALGEGIGHCEMTLMSSDEATLRFQSLSINVQDRRDRRPFGKSLGRHQRGQIRSSGLLCREDNMSTSMIIQLLHVVIVQLKLLQRRHSSCPIRA